MRKSIGRKILIKTLIIISVFIIISNNNVCQALSDVTDSSTWDAWQPTMSRSSDIENAIGVILGVVQTIGIIISVGALFVIGIKFMLGSPEEKSNYKQALVPWTIGAVMVFAITVIPNVIYNISSDAFGEITNIVDSSTEKGDMYLSGYDAGMKEAKDIFDEIAKNNTKTKTEMMEDYKAELLEAIEDTKKYNNNGSWQGQYFYGLYDALNSCKDYTDNEMQTRYMFSGHNDAIKEIQDGTITRENADDKRYEVEHSDKPKAYWLFKSIRIKYQVDYIWSKE